MLCYLQQLDRELKSQGWLLQIRSNPLCLPLLLPPSVRYSNKQLTLFLLTRLWKRLKLKLELWHKVARVLLLPLTLNNKLNNLSPAYPEGI